MRREPSVLPSDILRESTPWMRLASVLGGLGCVVAIVAALALTKRTGAPPEEPEVYVARQVSVPLEEAPPPSTPTDLVLPTLASPIQLEIAATGSPVRIQVPDVPQLQLDRMPPAARPAVNARFDLRKAAVRPSLDSSEVEARHVFERHEVDQKPMVLQRVAPRISYNRASEVEKPRTTMLLVVNIDGSVGEVRLLQGAHDDEFDEIMMEAVRQWRFSPAIRKGRKVRCWVQQAVTVRLSSGTPFLAN